MMSIKLKSKVWDNRLSTPRANTHTTVKNNAHALRAISAQVLCNGSGQVKDTVAGCDAPMPSKFLCDLNLLMPAVRSSTAGLELDSHYVSI